VSKTKIIVASLVWLAVLTAGVLIWKFAFEPKRKEAQEKEREQIRNEVLKETQGTSRYKYEITLGLDSFSGYAILRSADFESELKSHGIRLNIVDDQADYKKRLGNLESGSLQFAAFPADALIQTSASSQYPPATIIAIIDSTNGADALVAYKAKYPTIDSLNSPETKFVLVGDSPSETLARVVMHDFDSSRMGGNPFMRLSSPEAVVEAYKAATPSTPQVYVTWEPYVSQLTANDQMIKLVDSSRFTGYIIDTLVVSRDFLLKNQTIVETVLESYFRARFSFEKQGTDDKTYEQKMQALVLEDAKTTNNVLTESQTAQLVKTIEWKNTMENLAHFGIEGGKVMHIEDMLGRIHTVLKSTNAIDKNSSDAGLNNLFFEGPLKALHDRNFFPGVQSEKIRESVELPGLSDEQWTSLSPVGTLSTQQLVFARGAAVLTEQSRFVLNDLAENLGSWPHYYLMIRGNASSVGDLEANKALAAKRAEAALEYLVTQGIRRERMRVVSGDITGETNVTFVVGQVPY
jgi:flagellar motor protein MotB